MLDFVGTVGERLKLTLTTKASKLIHSGYGISTLITFHDPDGRVVRWFRSGEHNVELEVTEEYEASVKEHTVFGGYPETRIIRAVPYVGDKKKRSKLKKAAKKEYEDAQRRTDAAWANIDSSNDESVLEYRRLVSEADDLYRYWQSL
jgi:hypothetical protein